MPLFSTRGKKKEKKNQHLLVSVATNCWRNTEDHTGFSLMNLAPPAECSEGDSTPVAHLPDIFLSFSPLWVMPLLGWHHWGWCRGCVVSLMLGPWHQLVSTVTVPFWGSLESSHGGRYPQGGCCSPEAVAASGHNFFCSACHYSSVSIHCM